MKFGILVFPAVGKPSHATDLAVESSFLDVRCETSEKYRITWRENLVNMWTTCFKINLYFPSENIYFVYTYNKVRATNRNSIVDAVFLGFKFRFHGWTLFLC